MTIRQWKKKIYNGLATTIEEDVANGSGWLTTKDGDGEERLDDKEYERMKKAVDEVATTLRGLASRKRRRR